MRPCRGRVCARCRRVRSQVLLQGVDEPGFAEARFADDLNDLSHPLGGPLPATHEQAHFIVTADERCQTIGPGSFQPAGPLERLR